MFYPHSYQYTTPLLNSWQQFSLSEICNHTHNSRLRHRAQAEACFSLLLSTPFHSRVTPLHSGSLCSYSTWSLTRYLYHSWDNSWQYPPLKGPCPKDFLHSLSYRSYRFSILSSLFYSSTLDFSILSFKKSGFHIEWHYKALAKTT